MSLWHTGSSVVCLAANAAGKNSSCHFPCHLTVICCCKRSCARAVKWLREPIWLKQTALWSVLWSGSVLNCKNQQERKGRVKIMICIVAWVTAVRGNRKTLNMEHFAEEKVLASAVERIRLGGVVHPWQDRQMGRAAQSRTRATDSFNSFTTVIDSSVGPQGWISLIWAGTAPFISALCVGDVMGTGCAWGELCSWWTQLLTSVNCQDCKERSGKRGPQKCWCQRCCVRAEKEDSTTLNHLEKASLTVGFMYKGLYLDLA